LLQANPDPAINVPGLCVNIQESLPLSWPEIFEQNSRKINRLGVQVPQARQAFMVLVIITIVFFPEAGGPWIIIFGTK
jgi:hypothetical protein